MAAALPNVAGSVEPLSVAPLSAVRGFVCVMALEKSREFSGCAAPLIGASPFQSQSFGGHFQSTSARLPERQEFLHQCLQQAAKQCGFISQSFQARLAVVLESAVLMELLVLVLRGCRGLKFGHAASSCRSRGRQIVRQLEARLRLVVKLLATLSTWCCGHWP